MKAPNAKDSHRMFANFAAGIILGIGRIVYGFFMFIFSVLSSLA